MGIHDFYPLAFKPSSPFALQSYLGILSFSQVQTLFVFQWSITFGINLSFLFPSPLMLIWWLKLLVPQIRCARTITLIPLNKKETQLEPSCAGLFEITTQPFVDNCFLFLGNLRSPMAHVFD